jgi:hypothetical protein
MRNLDGRMMGRMDGKDDHPRILYPSSSSSRMRNLDGRMMGRMDGKDDHPRILYK